MPPPADVSDFDYVVAGHVTLDELDGRPGRVGGTAVYSAVQAARLGLRTLIVTRGDRAVIERLLEPLAGEVDVWVQPAPAVTTFATQGSGRDRVQRIIAWAGPVSPVATAPGAVLHLGPVARETTAEWGRTTAPGASGFVGVTPQGSMRRWDADGHVRLGRLEDQDLPRRCSAAVVSTVEYEKSAGALAAAHGRGAVCVITDGDAPAEVHAGPRRFVVAPRSVRALDDVGAGDVFAAALFVALAEGRRPDAAAVFAHAASVIHVSGAGFQAIGDRAAIEARVAAQASEGGGER